MIEMIVAVNELLYIGKDNSIPWNNKNDMAFFKKMTQGKTLVMGRKTQESLPIFPLKGRKCLTMVREKSEPHHISSVEEVTSLKEDVMIIGGEQIYRMFLPYTQRVYLNVILWNKVEGDTKFPFQEMKELFDLKSVRNTDDVDYCIFERKITN